MKNQPEQNFFAVIPAKVLNDKTLSLGARLLFACILSLTRATGYCYASNTYISEILGISIKTISRLLGELEDAKYVHRSISKGLDKNVIGTERKIFILIDTSQWGILGDVHILENEKVDTSEASGLPKNDPSSFKGKDKDTASGYLFRSIKELFIKRVFDLKGISYVFSGGRDGNAIKQFIARQIRPEYERLIDFYLKSEKAENHLSISAALSADTLNQFNLKYNRETEIQRIWKSKT